MQMTYIEDLHFIDEWVLEQIFEGKTENDLVGTTFVYQNKLLALTTKSDGSFGVIPLPAKEVVFVPQNKVIEENICTTCGMDHATQKDVLQCCASIE